ncbi:hypothetical protein B5S33_g2908 [[Candida] boidinii]|nr:hypothetical protein B5S33_g2908 [[Candida] boidinii]
MSQYSRPDIPPPAARYGAPSGAPPSQQQQYSAPSGAPPTQQQQYSAPSGAPPTQQQQYSAPSGAPPPSYPPEQQSQPYPVDSKQQYTAPSGPPLRSAETTLMPVPEEEYKALIPYTYITLNRIQEPDVFKEYLKLKSKRKGLGGLFGSKENKELAKSVDQRLINKPSNKGYKKFYSRDEDILDLLLREQCLPRIRRIANRFKVPRQEHLFYDLAQVCLFDIIFYIDNSGSMANGKRLQQLKQFLTLFMKINVSSNPLKIRILNNHDKISYQLSSIGIDLNNITTIDQLETLFDVMTVSGTTPLATNLDKLILIPEVEQKKFLSKPLLIIIFTDGAPYGDGPNTLQKSIKRCQNRLSNLGYSPKSVCYQIAQIGDDTAAGDYLDSLDDDRTIGDVIDCTSPIEKEMRQMRRKNPDLSTEVNYVKKLILGAIDISYDSMDEVSNKFQ